MPLTSFHQSSQPLTYLLEGKLLNSRDYLYKIGLYKSALFVTIFGASKEFILTIKVQGYVYHLKISHLRTDDPA